MKIFFRTLLIISLIGITAVTQARPFLGHITRADNWILSKNNPITLSEWLEFAKNEKNLVVSGPYTSYIHPVSKQHIPLIYEKNQITVHMLDKYVIYKMQKVAKKLDAMLQDANGESFEEKIEALNTD